MRRGIFSRVITDASQEQQQFQPLLSQPQQVLRISLVSAFPQSRTQIHNEARENERKDLEEWSNYERGWRRSKINIPLPQGRAMTSCVSTKRVNVGRGWRRRRVERYLLQWPSVSRQRLMQGKQNVLRRMQRVMWRQQCRGWSQGRSLPRAFAWCCNWVEGKGQACWCGKRQARGSTVQRQQRLWSTIVDNHEMDLTHG